MKKYVLVFCLLTCCVFCAFPLQLSSYSINGAATHVVATQVHNNKNLVYLSTIDGEFASVEAINSLVNKGYRIENPSLSYDGRTIVFAAQSPAKSDFDLYVCSFMGGKWCAPCLLSQSVNSLHDELSPSLSADGQTLYFIRRVHPHPNDRKGVTTNWIYSSQIDAKGRYSAPIATLFSLGEEYSVAILPDNETLLFTSQRMIDDSRPKVPHLYYSKRLPNNNWYDPVLLPLGDEQRFIPSSPTYDSRTHTIHYLATTTDKKPLVTHNTLAEPEPNFVLPLHHLRGVIGSVETNEPIAATITLSDIVSNSTHLVSAHDDGFYAFALTHGLNTVIDFTAPNCSHQYLRVNTQALEHDTYETFDCQLSHQIELTFMLYDGFILEPIDALLRITDFNNQLYRNIALERVDATSYRAVLPLGKAYRLHFTKEGYSPYTIHLAANREILFNHSQLDIELLPLTKQTSFEVIDATTQERIAAEVSIANQELPEQLLFSSSTHALVDTVLRASGRYTLSTSARGYIYDNQTIEMQHIDDNHRFTIALHPIVQGVTVQLSDVNFEYNSAEIMPASLSSLAQVLRLLETNPEVKIELAAHTDDRGNEEYNQQLSQKRAASVRNYLIEKGIAGERLNAVGYGKTKPLVPNTSDENRAKNRRVEFIVL